MKSIVIQNALLGEENGIDIDTICITKKHTIVKVQSFSKTKSGYCYAAHPWCLNNLFSSYQRLAVAPRSAYITNLHKITALKPLHSLKLSSIYDIECKFGHQAMIDFLIMQGFIKSFKQENQTIEKENSKKIKEAAMVLYNLIEFKATNSSIFSR